MKTKKLENETALFTNDGCCRAIFSGRKLSCDGVHFIEVMLDGIMKFRTVEFIKKELYKKDLVMANFPRYEEW